MLLLRYLFWYFETKSVFENVELKFLIFKVQVGVMVISCDKVIMEAERIVNVCQEVQEILPSNSRERNEIFRLLVLVNAKRPIYSAANYFVVNRKALLGLLSVTTTYFIVMVQFNQFF